jgi:hypothetical protein
MVFITLWVESPDRDRAETSLDQEIQHFVDKQEGHIHWRLSPTSTWDDNTKTWSSRCRLAVNKFNPDDCSN